MKRTMMAMGLCMALASGVAQAADAAASRWIDSEFQPSTLTKAQQGDGARLVRVRRSEAAPARRQGDLRGLRDADHARVRSEDAGPCFRGDHRHQGQARPGAGGRPGREAADFAAVRSQHLRRLGVGFRPHRHALPLRHDGVAHRSHGGRRQGVHQPGSRPEGLHRRALHHRAGRQALPAARPAVREPVLVPRRLVCAQGPAGSLPQEVRLRAGRARELERLRGHRRVLHQRREADRRQARVWPHGLRQEGSLAGLALHRCLAVDGRRGRPRPAQWIPGGRMGHSRRSGQVHAGGRIGFARRRDQFAGRGLRADQVRRLGEEVRARRRRWA